MSPHISAFTWQVEGRAVSGLQAHGEGPVLVLLHGNSSSSESFRPLMASTALAGRHMLAVDLPGHGCTNAPAQAHDHAVPALASWLQALLLRLDSHLGLDKPVVLVGHSLGGHVASHTAHAMYEQKQALEGLVLISAPPISVATMGQAFKVDAEAGDCIFKADLDPSEQQVLARALLGPAALHSDHLDQLLTAIQQTHALFRPSLGATLAQGLLADELDCIASAGVPTALIWGMQDVFLRADHLAAFRSPVPLGEGNLCLPNSGHSPHLDDTEHVGELLASLLKHLGPKSQA